MRYLSQRGRVDPKSLPRGPGGRALCRHCASEVPKGRRTFCGDKCVHEWKLRTQGDYLRAQVFKRDRARCSACGLDGERLERKIRAMWKNGQHLKVRRWMVRLGMEPLYQAWFVEGRTRAVWEVHHIKRVAEGGGACGLENLKTLCWACHQRAHG